MILPLAGILIKLVAVIWVIVSVALILLVLLQKGKGGGLGAAFGGAGSNSLLGTKTGDFLTWVTIGLVIVFLFFAVILAKYYRPSTSKELQAPAPVTAPAATPEAATEEGTAQPQPAMPEGSQEATPVTPEVPAAPDTQEPASQQ